MFDAALNPLCKKQNEALFKDRCFKVSGKETQQNENNNLLVLQFLRRGAFFAQRAAVSSDVPMNENHKVVSTLRWHFCA